MSAPSALVTGQSSTEASPLHGVSFGEAFRVWLRVALLSFGGPAGQIAVMHRIVVEEKRCIGEHRFTLGAGVREERTPTLGLMSRSEHRIVACSKGRALP